MSSLFSCTAGIRVQLPPCVTSLIGEHPAHLSDLTLTPLVLAAEYWGESQKVLLATDSALHVDGTLHGCATVALSAALCGCATDFVSGQGFIAGPNKCG